MENEEFYFEAEGIHLRELHNRPEDPALSIARARLEPGQTTRPHALVATTERYLIEQGVGVVFVGADRTGREVRPGDVVTIAPLEPQHIRNPGDEDLIFLALCTPRYRPHCYRSLD